MTDEERQELALLIASTQHWNDGYGLIVPEAMVNRLKAAGLHSGYSIAPSTYPGTIERVKCP